MSLDAFKNFASGTLSAGIASGATSLTLTTGHGARFPVAPFNATIWNSTDYGSPDDAFNSGQAEIVRVTDISTDTFTITRGQEGTTAVNLNTGGKTYKIAAPITAKTLNSDVPALAYSSTNQTLTAVSSAVQRDIVRTAGSNCHTAYLTCSNGGSSYTADVVVQNVNSPAVNNEVRLVASLPGSFNGTINLRDKTPSGTIIAALTNAGSSAVISVVSVAWDGTQWVLVSTIDPNSAYSPTTTKGDLIVRGASNDGRLPVGSDGQMLYADSTQTLGVRWGAAPSGVVGGSSYENLGFYSLNYDMPRFTSESTVNDYNTGGVGAASETTYGYFERTFSGAGTGVRYVNKYSSSATVTIPTASQMIEAWCSFKVSTLPNASSNNYISKIVGFELGSTDTAHIILKNDGKLYIRFVNSSTPTDSSVSFTIAANTVYRVGMRHDFAANTTQLIVNNTVVGTMSLAWPANLKGDTNGLAQSWGIVESASGSAGKLTHYGVVYRYA